LKKAVYYSIPYVGTYVKVRVHLQYMWQYTYSIVYRLGLAACGPKNIKSILEGKTFFFKIS
jgi:hypothetical protein